MKWLSRDDWPPPLRWLVPLIVAGLVIASALIESALDYREIRESIGLDQQAATALHLASAAEAFDYDANRGDMDRIRQKVALAVLAPHVVGSFVIDQHGHVAAATRLESMGEDVASAWKTLGLVAPPEALEMLRRPPSRQQPMVRVSDGFVWGAIAVTLPSARGEMRERARAWLVEVSDLKHAVDAGRAGDQVNMLGSLALMLSLVAALTLLMRGVVLRRIDALVSVAQRLKAGDFSARARLRGRDELTALGDAFDAMADNLDVDRRELADSEQRLRQIFEAASDGILLVHASGTLIDANPRACEMLGRPHAQLLALTWADVVDPTDVPARLSNLTEGEGASAGLVECRLLRGDGSQLTAELSARRLPEGRAIVVVRDLSERIALQAKLANAERMASIGTLAAGVAHEINNPLAYVLGSLALVTERMAHPMDARTQTDVVEMLQDAKKGAERMGVVVRDLSSFARSNDDDRHAVDLRAVVGSALKLTSAVTRERARVITQLDAVPPVLASEAKLGQVLINLLMNASQAFATASPGDNEIRVATGTDASAHAWVEVTDNGTGIRPETLPRIFEPFLTTKPAGLGTGLGLWVCQGIVSTLGGRIEVQTTLGQGTTFKVTLPPSDVVEAVPQPAQKPSSCEGLRVLLIDDDPMVARVFACSLVPAHVEIAGGGAEGLERMASAVFDVVLCDLHMPEVDGLAVYEHVQREWPSMLPHVLFISGGAVSERARTLVERLGDRVIEKPILPAALRQRVVQAAL